MKQRKIIHIILLMMIALCGCSDNRSISSDKEKIVLNERQKMILAESDLPIEYEELGYTQQKSIIAIEEMLQSVEAKYGMEFRYVGYILPGPLNVEKLVACAMDGYDSIDSFSVTREMVDGEYVYTDEYMCVAVRDAFSSYIETAIKTELEMQHVKVFSSIANTSLEYVPEDYSEMEGTVWGQVTVFLDGGVYSEEQMSEFTLTLKDWMKEHEMECILRVVLLKENILPELNLFNYTVYFKEHCIKDIYTSISL